MAASDTAALVAAGSRTPPAAPRRLGPVVRRRPRISSESAAALSKVEHKINMDSIRPSASAAAGSHALRRLRAQAASPPPPSGGTVGAAVVESQRGLPRSPPSPMLHAMPEFVHRSQDDAPGFGSSSGAGAGAGAGVRAAAPPSQKPQSPVSLSPLRRMMEAERRALAQQAEEDHDDPAVAMKRTLSLRRLQSLSKLNDLMEAEQEASAAATNVPPRSGGTAAATTSRMMAAARHPIGGVSQEVHDALLVEWLDGYQGEQDNFASAAIAAEVKLRRAEVFTQHLPRPNPLLTAVAFEVLDLVGGLFGRYNGLMKRVRNIMFQVMFAAPHTV